MSCQNTSYGCGLLAVAFVAVLLDVVATETAAHNSSAEGRGNQP